MISSRINNLFVYPTRETTQPQSSAVFLPKGVWRGEGRCGEARDRIAPVHSRFTEGLDTRDLIEAKVLIDDLR
jgi:hypothetical protein